MRLEHLSILNYKNIQQLSLSFSPNINCIIGKNGMGKTNLLDAIYYLSFTKSAFSVSDTSIIKHGEKTAMVKGSYVFNDSRESEICCALGKHRKKTILRDKKAYTTLSDHIGMIPLVIVSPYDNSLIIGTGEERRKFLDISISQYNPLYLQTLIRYGKALKQRNSLLKASGSDALLLDIIEEQMGEDGQFIMSERKSFLERILPSFNHYYNAISLGNEQVDLSYAPSFKTDQPASELASARNKDQILGFSSIGIHRDDIVMRLNGSSLKKEGSQGQHKTFLLALKFAQYHLMEERSQDRPILLLDDIFDRLDRERVERIIGIVSSDNFGQIFISDTNHLFFNKIFKKEDVPHQFFSAENGEINALNVEG